MAASARKGFEVLVCKVPWFIANKELKEYFGQFGHVIKCNLPFNKDTGLHKGICWIRFSSKEEQTKALQQNPHVLEGTTLLVEPNTHQFSGHTGRFNRDGDLMD